MNFHKSNFIKFLVVGIFIIGCYFIFGFCNSVSAATDISSDPLEHWAWNDIIGWIDFYYTENVNVFPAKLIGYASSSVGYIAFDCATSPNGDVCGSPATWQVSNDGSGNLSGYAWSESIGWISFYCGDLEPSCTTFNHRVTIDSSGDFSGWAWNDIVGWIDFNCANDHDSGTPGTQDICDTSNFKVKTSWTASAATSSLLSSIFDTGVADGVAFNSIMWKGSQPSGTHVKFQFASSNQITGSGTGPIDTTYRYAWNDSTGWWDFGYSAGSVTVSSTQLTGYAYNSNIYEISLDCATAPGGSVCGTSDYKVSRDPATGDLSGWAWNDTIGWISFASSTYKVTVNTSTGIFTGWAWNDDVGWISFNCADTEAGCGDSSYYVAVTQGFAEPIGPMGTSLITDTYDTAGPESPVALNRAYHNNHRYYRYKIILESNYAQTTTPRVDEVIVNWSP